MENVETLLASEELNKTKRGDLLSIDPRNIEVDEKFNVRADYGDIESLMESILNSGQQEPLIVTKIAGTTKYLLTDGFRRMRAVNLALEKGLNVPYVKAIVGSHNQEDRIFSMVITGTGKKPLTMLEEGEAYKLLKDFGYDVKEIAGKVGKTQVHIYECLKLSDVPKQVKNKIIADKVSGRTVLALLKEAKTAEDIIAAVDKAVENAEQEHERTGKKAKATTRHTGKLSTMKTLEKALEHVDAATHTNADLLKKVFNGLRKGVKPETIASYFA